MEKVWTLWSTAYFRNCTRTYTVPRNRNGNRMDFFFLDRGYRIPLEYRSWKRYELECCSFVFAWIFRSLVYDRACRELALGREGLAVSKWMEETVTNFREKSLRGNDSFGEIYSRWFSSESKTLNQLKACSSVFHHLLTILDEKVSFSPTSENSIFHGNPPD